MSASLGLLLTSVLLIAGCANVPPSIASAPTVNGELDMLIREAFQYTYPVHEMARTRSFAVDFERNPRRTDVNKLVHRRQLLDHKAREVTTPNNDTLYSSAWLDLSAGPLALTVPPIPDRYFSLAFMDLFTNNFAYIGRRTTGSQGGEWWVVGPKWSGAAPDVVKVIRAPSNDVWLLGRILVDGPEDTEAVHRIQDQIKLRAIDPATQQAAVAHRFANAPVALGAVPSPDRYLATVNEMFGRNPIPPNEIALVRRFAAVGVIPGRPDAWDSLPQTVRDAWAAHLPGLLVDLRKGGLTSGVARNGWVYVPPNLGNFGTDYAIRATAAATLLGALEVTEAIYPATEVDEDGDRLMGGRRYRLHMPANLPLDAFWSLSMYEATADGRYFFVDNPIHRYAIGDRTRGIQPNADGSVDIWMQSDAPIGREAANWLPSPASGPFRLLMRAYQPRAELIHGRVLLPAVQRMDR